MTHFPSSTPPATSNSTRWAFEKWTEAEIDAVNTVGHRLPKKRAGSISGLYLIASGDRTIIRPGAIGVNRKYIALEEIYAKGNSAKARLKQYNARMADGNSKRTKLPWSGKPWSLIWLTQFVDSEITPAEISIAEQTLHFRVANAGFKPLGSSCHLCAPEEHAKLKGTADEAILTFQNVAPLLLDKTGSLEVL